jgi:hypothetical protein
MPWKAHQHQTQAELRNVDGSDIDFGIGYPLKNVGRVENAVDEIE